MIHRVGKNPYIMDSTNPYKIGEERKKILRQWQETNILPEGFAAWDDKNKTNITDADQVDW